MSELSGNFRIIDRLLEIPYEGEPSSRAVGRVERATNELQELVPLNWLNEGAEIFIPSLKVSTCTALLPSLKAIAADTAHDRVIAQDVTQNLAAIGTLVCNTERLRPPGLNERSNVKGALSEFAVLSALWSMTANGILQSDCYILPTASHEDRADKQNGYRMGADLILVRSQAPDVQKWIQVKASNDNGSRKAYHPDTVHLSVSNLMEEPGPGKPLDLIEVVTKNDTSRLKRIGSQARVRFAIAQARKLADEAGTLPHAPYPRA